MRVIGDPNEYARKYNVQGIDEILFLDTVASLYGRNALHQLVSDTSQDVFCPITVGGGIRTVDDAARLFRSGADKIAINTAATANPRIITELAEKFGCQAIVAQIDVKRYIWPVDDGGPGSAYTNMVWCDGGRENTGKCAEDWARQVVELGAGEILLTSIDREGTQTGFSTDLIHSIAQNCKVPVIASGGMGSIIDAAAAFEAGADAIAMAHCLHYDTIPLKKTRDHLLKVGIPIREAA